MAGAKSWLRVEHSESDRSGVRLLRVSGELDLGTIGELRDAVEEHLSSGARIVLDLAGLSFCDSTGLGAMIKLHRQTTNLGGAFALSAPGARVADVLRISGVDQVIPVYPTADAAVKALAAS